VRGQRSSNVLLLKFVSCEAKRCAGKLKAGLSIAVSFFLETGGFQYRYVVQCNTIVVAVC
jgi:hypothetical protein